MLLLTPLLWPLIAALLLLSARRWPAPRVTRLAGWAAGIEVALLAAVVGRVYAAGPLSYGAYWTADALTAFFLLTTGLVFGVVVL